MEDHARIKPVGILSHHSGSVWGVQTSCSDESLGDFASCSADGTIRFWTLARNPAGQGPSPGRVPDGAAAWILPDDAEGGYELTKIVYADRDSFRRDNQQLGQFSPLTATLPKNDAAATEAIRTFSISNDGRYLAAGSVSGGLRVYGLPECNLMVHMEGHDSEILSIDFLTEHPT
ncbi:MAG: hypothetical protein BJ554DRAFT_8002 [Olpidium bornovanus]|uniref:Uncharacterized protein n=1 Tax=Olpidium bornovanus TaxID=278681 RepID=A0A8H8DM28_9FUNG|nr:MAG: hypothetical protein BJ554DRAFT_8002 [Olpidium bornovanus]